MIALEKVEQLRKVMHRRYRISYDVDGVLADIMQAIFGDVQPNYPVKGDDNFVEFQRKYKSMWIDGWNVIRRLVEPEALASFFFQQKGKVDIVTARGSATLGALDDWLKLNYPEITFKVVSIGLEGDKTKLHEYNIFIDDAPGIALNMRKHKDKFLFLVNKEYNANVGDELKNVLRVNDAAEAQAIISKVAEEVKTEKRYASRFLLFR